MPGFLDRYGRSLLAVALLTAMAISTLMVFEEYRTREFDKQAHIEILQVTQALSTAIPDLKAESQQLSAQAAAIDFSDLDDDLQALSLAVSDLQQSLDYSAELESLNQAVKALHQPAVTISAPVSETLPVWDWNTSFEKSRELFNQCVLANTSQQDIDHSWVQDYLETVGGTLDSGLEYNANTTHFFLVNLGASHNCWRIGLE